MTDEPSRHGDPALADRLRRETSGEVLFDPYSRGRYSTDASIYQIEPVGVVVPKTTADVQAIVAIAAEEGVAILPRGAGTSQCGQTVGAALVVDFTKHLKEIVEIDAAARRARVQPGVVLDDLNRALKPDGLFFPVDVSTASRATIGGMAGNNSCGARSIRYGNMVHNVRAIDAVLADGGTLRFADVPGNLDGMAGPADYRSIVQRVRGLADRESAEIAARVPKLLRRVGGYNIDTISPAGHNMAHLLVGSEGTLAAFTEIELALQPIPPHAVLGVCHFATLRAAMEATPAIVELGPAAVELVDDTMIDLARDIAIYRDAIARFVRGTPGALLLVEFAGEDAAKQRAGLAGLVTLMADLGHADGVVEAVEPAIQKEIWEVRKAALNIMMSMKGDGKPISFIEDCAVALDDLADYTERLTEVFARHGTTGTWYAHASVGCLHVRPILNMKAPEGAATMRAIAEEAFAMVRAYKGSHSGEHGDGLVRSEFHAAMFGSRVARTFEAVKDTFDPAGLFNPGKIVRPARMDDRTLFRYPPGYAAEPVDTALDWSAWGGFLGAVEMCNNNGACRKADPGVMCPSYRVTANERDLTRGRANSLRLALTGQLGARALASDAMRETMDLCVACKGCRRECPTGVDMARMKIEVRHQRRKHARLSPRERLIAYLPRYAPWAARLRALLNLRDRVPALARLSEAALGFSARRSLPTWQRPAALPAVAGPADAPEVVLLADTFTTYFEPDIARAGHRVLLAAGYRVQVVRARNERRPLCCGRTFLAAGLVEEARAEARRVLRALAPFLDRDVPVVGLEPSCLLTLRDEFTALLPGDETTRLADNAYLFEEFLANEKAAGRLHLDLSAGRAARALLHGHCHQKAFGTMDAVAITLALVPDLEVARIESTCCGMAGAFGYEKEHYETSMAMAELSLLPAVRKAVPEALIVADGTSCRHQIRDGAGRQAKHVAEVLAAALAGAD